MKKVICNFFEKDWTMSEKVLLVSAVSMAGMLLGFLLSPVKHRCISCGNHSGNYSGSKCFCETEDGQDYEKNLE